MTATVLIVGGGGVFGSRLAERLALSCDCNILIGGRSYVKAARVVSLLASMPLRATLRPYVIDRDNVTSEELRSSGASIVVDASGPFQGQEPRLARVAIAAGCHFVDLADARDYVPRFTALHEEALKADVLAVCCASSTPSLSHAVLDALKAEAGTPEEINVIISPGNRAPRGISVVRAILSYVGRPVLLRENGVTRTRVGWSLLHRRRLKGLQIRWFSLCETPDLDLIPQRFPSVRTARFYAGLELGILHCGLWILSLLVRARLLRSLIPWAPALHAVAEKFERFGTDRGGMLVEALGYDDDGRRISAHWGLIAEAGEGPYIPTLPALALIRRLLSGQESRRGAMACVGLLTLSEILDEAEGLKIQTYREIKHIDSLFKRVLGDAFGNLPPVIRELHSPRGTRVFSGIAQVDKADNFIGNLFARLFRFPPAASDIPVEVVLEPRAGREIWRRRFGNSSFESTLGIDGRNGRLTEQFGPIRFTLVIDGHAQGIDMKIVSAKVGILSLPRLLVPWTRAYERVDAEGRFTFDVEIGLPGVGRLVRYRGWLVPRYGSP